jgi:hypothetical protein
MENTYIGEMIEKLGGRLAALKIKAAQYGIDAPVHVLTEIEDIETQMQELQMSTKSLVSIELLQRQTPLEIWKRLYDAIWEVEIRLHTLIKNAEADRIRLQSRHTEFNTVLQRSIFEIELLKRNQTKHFYASIAFVVLVIMMLFIFALLR